MPTCYQEKLTQKSFRVFYLLNLHIKSRHTYFARAGTSREEDSYKTDASLSEQGVDYARKMGETLLRHREREKQAMIDRGGPDIPLKRLTIWTSTRRRTVETSQYLYEQGYRVRQRSQMSQLNPGVCEKKSEKRIRLEYPEEVAKHEADPYHHRYPRAEVSCSNLLKLNLLNGYRPVLSRPGGKARTHHIGTGTGTK